MQKVLQFIRKNIFGFILGLVIAGVVGVYAVSVASSDVTYDNTNSGSSATTVKDAIDDLYTQIENGAGTTRNDPFLSFAPINYSYKVPTGTNKAIYITGAYQSSILHNGTAIDTQMPYSANNGAGLNYTDVFNVSPGDTLTTNARWATYGNFIFTGPNLKVYITDANGTYTFEKSSNNAQVFFGAKNGTVTLGNETYKSTCAGLDNNGAGLYYIPSLTVNRGDTITINATFPLYGILVIY